MTTELELPFACDLHVHLRQGNLMKSVTPKLTEGGVQTAFVMPNLTPPIRNTEQALKYWEELKAINPDVTYLMSLYLSPELTPEEIFKASENGIVGVKSYPRGVTTNSESGIESYETYYPIFEAMEKCNMVLNLHGEIPSNPDQGICILNAEEKFLVELQKLHARFPKLRIVLEHATTKAAVEMVKSLGDTVGCTITVHHLDLIIDDWASNTHNFCKPVAKFPHDRDALRQIVKEGHPRFFLGSDSAPHPKHAKLTNQPCAGVYTTPHILPYLATVFEKLGCLENLENYSCLNGAKFYQLDLEKLKSRKLKLVKETWQVPEEHKFTLDSGEPSCVVPFLAGKSLNWRIL
jgi:dihydroorotase